MDPPISADVESSSGNCSESKASTRRCYLEMVNTVAAESEVHVYCFNVYDFRTKFSLKALTVTRKRKPLSGSSVSNVPFQNVKMNRVSYIS